MLIRTAIIAVSRTLSVVASAGLITLARGYQVAVSPLLIGSCKYTPSCSEYFIQAVRGHGAMRGGWMGVRRILRCHPFARGGWDPVPPR